MYVYIYIYICVVRQKSTPQKSSWTFSGMFQHVFIVQLYVQNDCHFSSGFPLELSNGFSSAFSNGISLL